MPHSLSAYEYVLDNCKRSDRIAVLKIAGCELFHRCDPLDDFSILAIPKQDWLTEKTSSGIRDLHRHEHAER
jgi:hypothetical protein